MLSRNRALIFGFNVDIILDLEQHHHAILFRSGTCVTAGVQNHQMQQVSVLITDLLRRLTEQFAKNLHFRIVATHGKDSEALLLQLEEQKHIIVSTPAMGPDGAGTFSFDVMGALQVLAYWDLVSLAYVWVGSTNQFVEDEPFWDRIFSRDIAPSEHMSLVHKTLWFHTYKGQVKGAVRLAVLQCERVAVVVIKEGPISQAEKMAMPTIKELIERDLLNGCNMVPEDIDIEIVYFTTY